VVAEHTGKANHHAIRQALLRLGLTRRESEVLCGVAQGLTNTAIAGLLGISPRTVHKHLERIFVKRDVTTRTEAALRAAAELGMLGPFVR
jgi:DNA-binding NarL/FixJ family response regulator